jgi:luciferase family oxidoreductase group 1
MEVELASNTQASKTDGVFVIVVSSCRHPNPKTHQAQLAARAVAAHMADMTTQPRLSVLDLSPVPEGGDVSQSLANSLDLARHAERLGYHRFWLAEHHNMTGIASAATAVVIGHVAAGTKNIRVGAGGIMLPNHAPLMVAEAFGTLNALHPGRIDLGLGRAPGTDQITAQALRRNLHSGPDDFPRDVVELLHYFKPAVPGQRVRAVPGAGQDVPVWILGSSTYGAQLAAALGLPYAFASHFAPQELDRALAVYRAQFQPSEYLDKPHVMLGLNVTAAESDDEARYLFSSLQQAFVNMRTGTPGPLPRPVENYEAGLGPAEKAVLAQALSCAVVGGPAAVRGGIAAFAARTGADELMITGSIHDHPRRVRSFEIAMG